MKKYRCDIPMAKKKGIYRFCNKKCKGCICAIGMNEIGIEEHTHDLQDGGCANTTVRNLEYMSGWSDE